MIIRLYTGEDGQSHVEELKMPSGEATSVALKAGADMTFHHNPEGHFSDWHNAPRRQYVISSCRARRKSDWGTERRGI